MRIGTVVNWTDAVVELSVDGAGVLRVQIETLVPDAALMRCLAEDLAPHGGSVTVLAGMAVSAFNAGTAIGSLLAGVALDSSLGATGPAVVGTAIVSMTLIPTTALAVAKRRRSTTPAACGVPVPR